MTTVEALACGTNVIVRNSTALPEIVDYDCMRIATNDEDWDGKIKVLDCEKYKIGNRKLAYKYEKGQQYLKYMNLYEQMLNGK